MPYYTILTPETTGEGLDGVKSSVLIELLSEARDDNGRPCFGQVKEVRRQAGIFVEVLGEDAQKTNENTRTMNEIIKKFRS
jgi:hypothetical protein